MKKIQGFNLIEERWLEEENSSLLYYEHEKTGAKIFHMKNDDSDKVFTIGFRTPPIGSTGNCHILEHSVLNGSRKYRTKEPFMDMLKRSLSTFLNAMTYPDKTIYPVASRNDADFNNLMDLYLDAVFFPAVKENELIFRQEGWHYHIMDKNDPITYSGVVYNEMRGAMSSADDQIEDAISRSLFPGSIYAQNSGGDPYHIPDLSYEDFIKFHDEYYHPSNSYIFLYGNMDQDETYAHIGAYLDEFERKDVDSMPRGPKHFDKPVEDEVSFAIASGDDPEGKDYLSLSWIVDQAKSDTSRYLYKLLAGALVKSESSPLRRALFDELGALDVRASLYDVKEIGFSIIVKGVAPDKKDLFLKIVMDKLGQMAEKGIDRKALEGLVRGMEYRLREKDGMATKGIVLMDRVMNEGLYGCNPMDILAYDRQLEELKELLADGALEKYVSDKLLNNPHRVLLVHKAVPGLNVSRDKAVEEKLAAYKKSLSPKELDLLIEKNKTLETRQNADDSPEDKASLPNLSKDQLPQSIAKVPREVGRVGDSTLLLHRMNTSGIVYLDLVFDINHMGFEDLPYLGLLANLLGQLDTKKHTYEEYGKLESIYTGGIGAGAFTVEKHSSRDFDLTFTLSSKFLGLENLEKGLDLMTEQAIDSLFTDRKRLKELVNISLASMESSIVPSGHSYAAMRSMAKSNAALAYVEEMTGLSYYMFLQGLAKDLKDEDVDRLVKVYSSLTLGKNRLVNLTASSDLIDGAVGLVEKGLAVLPQPRDLERAPLVFEPKKMSEAFSLASDVQFAGIAAPFHKDKLPHKGSYEVLATILSLTYLYNEIRAKGGAYGQGMAVSRDDMARAISYRDPHLKRTVDIMMGMGDFVANLDMPDNEFYSFLVGTIGAFDTPMTEKAMASKDMLDYIKGTDPDFYNRILEEIKATKLSDIKALAPQIDDFLKRASLTVIGSKEKLETYDFDKFINL